MLQLRLGVRVEGRSGVSPTVRGAMDPLGCRLMLLPCGSFAALAVLLTAHLLFALSQEQPLVTPQSGIPSYERK